MLPKLLHYKIKYCISKSRKEEGIEKICKKGGAQEKKQSFLTKKIVFVERGKKHFLTLY